MTSSKIIAGVDEVGRGSLVGSVFSAAVILSDDTRITNLKDSKKLSANKRIKIANDIIKKSIAVSIGCSTKEEIDAINIHHATLLSMRRAIENLRLKPDIIYVDGLFTPKVDIQCEAVVGGDSKIAEISAASIVAKVARDFDMDFIHRKYEMYNIKKNNGYGTREHMEAIEHFGKTIYHRDSFVK